VQNKQEFLEDEKQKDKNILIMPCDCYALDHLVHFEITKDGSFNSISGTLQVFLNRQPSFWKRLVIGFKYIFKRQPSEWYEIDGTILNEYQLTKLRDFITEKLNSNGNV